MAVVLKVTVWPMNGGGAGSGGRGHHAVGAGLRMNQPEAAPDQLRFGPDRRRGPVGWRIGQGPGFPWGIPFGIRVTGLRNGSALSTGPLAVPIKPCGSKLLQS